jgi:hypothetical protein
MPPGEQTSNVGQERALGQWSCVYLFFYTVLHSPTPKATPFMHMQPSVAQRWVAQRNARLRNAKLHCWNRAANTENIATDLFFSSQKEVALLQ